MSGYLIVERPPPVADFNRLREVAGWGAYPVEVAEGALARSLYGVHALCDAVRGAGAVVGMARVVGDGCVKFYIEDVVVEPAHQGRGVGALLMDRVMAYLRGCAIDGATIGLMAASGKEGFYERHGFIRRPNGPLGAGMTQFWRPG